MIMHIQNDESMEDELNQYIESIGEMIEEEDRKMAIIVPQRYDNMRFTYAVLKYLTRGTGAEVSYKFNEPYKSMGSVSVEAKAIMFHNPEWFSRAAEFANSVDVYPLTNGKMRMDFTFHGITTPIE